MDARDQAALDQRHDRARRHRRTRRARRQRDAGGVAGGGAAAAAPARQPLYRYLRLAAMPAMLPVPMMNIINGGAHADNNVDIQEFMILPVGRRSFCRGAALRRGGLPRAQERCCTKRGLSTAVGDEGGFAPDLPSNEAALEVDPARRSSQAGYKPGQDICLALDVASSRVLSTTAHTISPPRSRHVRRRRACPTTCADLVRAATRSSPSRTAWPKATGRAGSC